MAKKSVNVEYTHTYTYIYMILDVLLDFNQFLFLTVYLPFLIVNHVTNTYGWEAAWRNLKARSPWCDSRELWLSHSTGKPRVNNLCIGNWNF